MTRELHISYTCTNYLIFISYFYTLKNDDFSECRYIMSDLPNPFLVKIEGPCWCCCPVSDRNLFPVCSLISKNEGDT